MDWRGIPGNDHAFERLCKTLRGRDTGAFVGAGASAGLYPLWAGLIRRLAEEAVNRGRADPADRDHWLRSFGEFPDGVVHGIKAKLGDGIYAEALRDIFRSRPGSDGNHFTPLHGLLLRLPFKGYITTNFDHGLIEARLKLRPDSRATGFGTWKDRDIIDRWRTGDIFTDQPCPILFAHGIYDRVDTVVLGTGEYRDAYKSGAFRPLFSKLWDESRLVVVGFSFSDPWVRFMINEVLMATGPRSGEPRHTALIGLRPDHEYSASMRMLFADQFHAEPLFYPLADRPDGGEDHGALATVLEALAAEIRSAAPTAPPPLAAPAAVVTSPVIPKRWTHETTEDDRFTGRAEALGKLDRWAADAEVQVVAITGLGGLGKTSLIGHWLKKKDGDRKRPINGLFFWSFYADRDVDAFAKAFVEFAIKEAGAKKPAKGIEPSDAALVVLRDKRFLLVLDGLEVLQELPETAGYGTLIEDDLRELLDGACRLRHGGLVVLTSRFPFADLTPYLGSSFRALDLDRLGPHDGAALLVACGVGGTIEDQEAISRRLDGHPLGLRIFALTLTDEVKGDPTRLVEQVFDAHGLSDDDPLERKLKHLLGFYERGLPRDRVALLGLVSLFRTATPEVTILTLAHSLPDVRVALGNKPDTALRMTLEAMGREHLLIRDRPEDGETAWSCHPVLRDHFRSVFLKLGADVGTSAANLLAGAPSAEQPQNIRALEPILAAIELLLDAKDFHSADRLYEERFDNGQIFLTMPAPAAGMQCALGFVRDGDRRNHCKEIISEKSLSFYLNEVGIFSEISGEYSLALTFYKLAEEIDRGLNNNIDLAIGLLNQSKLLSTLGRLSEAETQIRCALDLFRHDEIPPDLYISNSLSWFGFVSDQQGRIGEALAAFEAANTIEHKTSFADRSLYGIDGVNWAELLLRTGDIDRAKSLSRQIWRFATRTVGMMILQYAIGSWA